MAYCGLFFIIYFIIYYRIIFRLFIGMEVLWPLKDLSMDDVVTIIGLQQCFVTMDGCNNLGKKQISCRDEDLLEFLFENVNEVEELGGI